MSETTENKPKVTIPTIQVTRVGTELVGEFVHTEGKKGDLKGVAWPAPKIVPENVESWIKWFKLDFVAAKLQAVARQLSLGWHTEAKKQATKEDGTMDYDKYSTVFATLASNVSARGETMGDLEDQMEELTDAMNELDPDADNFRTEFKRLTSEYKQLKAVYESKKRERKEKTETPAPEAAK